MRFLTLSLICLLSLAPFGCQRDEGVQAGREDGNAPETYQPRAAPIAPGHSTDPGMDTTATSEVRGEVVRVDTKAKTVVVRLTNGMEHTVQYDDATAVTDANVDANTATKPGQTAAQAQMTKMKAMKAGATVVIRYNDAADSKMATSINITNEKANTKHQ